jgi:hypothetical protein
MDIKFTTWILKRTGLSPKTEHIDEVSLHGQPVPVSAATQPLRTHRMNLRCRKWNITKTSYMRDIKHAGGACRVQLITI